MEDRGEVLYELSPKFDFLYELTMPTGKKMKSAIVGAVISVIINIILLVFRKDILSLDNISYSMIYKACSIICLIILIFMVLMAIVRIVMQSLEYKGIKYTFYKDCLVFENTFLNQTRKTIEYSNIKEIEIRKTIIDRILNYGVIIIYTNADKGFGSATILYAIKNTEEHYNNIESLVHSGKVISSPIKSEDLNKNLKEEVDLQNAMNRNEIYTESNAKSDNNPLQKRD